MSKTWYDIVVLNEPKLKGNLRVRASTPREAKEMFEECLQRTCADILVVVAEWEVEDKSTGFRHRIVLKDENGTILKTSYWTPYRGIAYLDFGGRSYRACTEFHNTEMPVCCVFTVDDPGSPCS